MEIEIEVFLEVIAVIPKTKSADERVANRAERGDDGNMDDVSIDDCHCREDCHSSEVCHAVEDCRW